MAEVHQVDLTRALQALRNDAEPRMVAIVGAAYIETYLKALVRKRLPYLNSDLNERLFDPGRPFSDMGTLIDVARALNAITSRGQREAIKISRVRNRFAHNVAVNDFDHPDVARIVDTMDAFRGYKLAGDGLYDVDDANMSRQETFVSLVREFCFSIESELTGPGNWTVDAEDLRAVPHEPSPRKSRGRSRHAPEGLTNQ